MKEQITKVSFENGLHARQIALCVQTASQFDSSIYICSGNVRMNAKSIMGLMAMGITQGSEITIAAEGPDEDAALEKMTEYFS